MRLALRVGRNWRLTQQPIQLQPTKTVNPKSRPNHTLQSLKIHALTNSDKLVLGNFMFDGHMNVFRDRKTYHEHKTLSPAVDSCIQIVWTWNELYTEERDLWPLNTFYIHSTFVRVIQHSFGSCSMLRTCSMITRTCSIFKDHCLRTSEVHVVSGLCSQFQKRNVQGSAVASDL